jgi:hypothetical protein
VGGLLLFLRSRIARIRLTCSSHTPHTTLFCTAHGGGLTTCAMLPNPTAPVSPCDGAAPPKTSLGFE